MSFATETLPDFAVHSADKALGNRLRLQQDLTAVYLVQGAAHFSCKVDHEHGRALATARIKLNPNRILRDPLYRDSRVGHVGPLPFEKTTASRADWAHLTHSTQ
jgi:hypothetical protein